MNKALLTLQEVIIKEIRVEILNPLLFIKLIFYRDAILKGLSCNIKDCTTQSALLGNQTV